MNGAPRMSDVWSSLPAATRRAVMQHVIQQARETAATAIMLQSQGGPNDILRTATEAKMAQAPAPASSPAGPAATDAAPRGRSAESRYAG